MNEWKTSINNSRDLLLKLSARDMKGQDIDTDLAFKYLKNYTLGILERRKTIYFVGNGASASIANDASVNLAKNTSLNTETFFNFSLLTAIANNSSYEEIFAAPLRKKMVSGDMLIAISSSGQSQNIINAAREALRIGGSICTLSAMNPENSLRSLGTLNFFIPAEYPGNAHLCHMEIMNYWIDQMISTVSWQEDLKETYTSNYIAKTVYNNF